MILCLVKGRLTAPGHGFQNCTKANFILGVCIRGMECFQCDAAWAIFKLLFCKIDHLG